MFTYKVVETDEDCVPYGLLFRSMQHNVAQSKLNSFAQQPAIGKFKTTSTFFSNFVQAFLSKQIGKKINAILLKKFRKKLYFLPCISMNFSSFALVFSQNNSCTNINHNKHLLILHDYFLRLLKLLFTLLKV